MSPISNAAGCPSGICRLSFACADWYPAVTRPSTHSAEDNTCRACAIWDAVRTSGTVINMVLFSSNPGRLLLLENRSEPEVEAEESGSTCSGHNVRRMDFIDVVAIGHVEDIHLQRQVVAKRIAAHRVEHDVTWYLLCQACRWIQGNSRAGRGAVYIVAPAPDRQPMHGFIRSP